MRALSPPSERPDDDIEAILDSSDTLLPHNYKLCSVSMDPLVPRSKYMGFAWQSRLFSCLQLGPSNLTFSLFLLFSGVFVLSFIIFPPRWLWDRAQGIDEL